ncbi:MAG: PLP-dependent transferase [Planctomycetota bacterium]|nr:PLP-dependent transferase [Planctomycetota bacterium]
MSQSKKLSPRRNSTQATTVAELVDEQLDHFGIDPKNEYGQTLKRIVSRMYESQHDIEQLWQLTMESMNDLDQTEKIHRFNAKKFLSFQLAKLLDTLQHPFRKSYQSLGYSGATQIAKGPYPVFDNVTALFSATPVITRTATYIYACAEWIADAFKGKELMLEIYSRLLNPTSVCLANHIVDLEAGPYANEYLAWNFNSGMAAIDAVLSHVLGRDDILITSRNIYGGAYQLIHDWYAKKGNLEVSVETFDGYRESDFSACLDRVREKYADQLAEGRKIYVYLESPCNPHGYVLDVAEICKKAHTENLTVMLDATVGTPFLYRTLQREDPAERPDYVIHSYTKDLSGCGGAIAGCVIGRNENMFIPKGESFGDFSWDQTMFWNVYYVKGAFLNADAAFEVMQGMRTLTVRMLRKCINTLIFAKFLDSHPDIKVHCNAVVGNDNFELCQKYMHLGLPAPLFTIEMGEIRTDTFKRFIDALSPTFGHMISLGQSNTIVSCPALTTHSELDTKALEAAGLTPTTIRFAVGDEDPFDLIRHLVYAARGTIDMDVANFSAGFMDVADARELVRQNYAEAHAKFVDVELQHCPGY